MSRKGVLQCDHCLYLLYLLQLLLLLVPLLAVPPRTTERDDLKFPTAILN